MIYSKFNKFYNFLFKEKLIGSFNNLEFNDNDIFYYHPYYQLHYDIKIIDSFNDLQWNHMKDNRSTKLFYENVTETVDEFLINDLVLIIKEKEILPEQIFILVIDEIHRLFLVDQFKKNNINGIHVGISNNLINKVKIPLNTGVNRTRRFSSLSRNYRPWRLHMYAELVQRGLINDFNYSFYNIDPYENKSFTLRDMQEDLQKTKFKKDAGREFKRVFKWLSGIPYELEGNVYNKWSDVSYDCILSSDFHLLIETHYDTFKTIKPTFITEKTYKAIACNRPFIVCSTPNFLKDLRDTFGFKTFNPWINESYDLEFNNARRMEMIATEIERLIQLPPDQYNIILKECSKISFENLEIFKKIIQSEYKFNEDFDFLKELVSDSTNLQIF